MTTIAYNHKDKEIAVESRMSRGNLIVTDDAIKATKSGGVLFIQSGCKSDYDILIDQYLNGPSGKVTKNIAFVIDNGKAFKIATCDDEGFWIESLECNDATGSGGSFAISAMDFGCNAREAVKYAIKRDCYSGGKIKVYKVK